MLGYADGNATMVYTQVPSKGGRRVPPVDGLRAVL